MFTFVCIHIALVEVIDPKPESSSFQILTSFNHCQLSVLKERTIDKDPWHFASPTINPGLPFSEMSEVISKPRRARNSWIAWHRLIKAWIDQDLQPCGLPTSRMRSSSAAEHCSEQAKQESWWVACIRGEGGGRCAAEANDLFGLVICPPLPSGLGTQKQGNQFGEPPPPLRFPDTGTGLDKKCKQLPKISAGINQTRAGRLVLETSMQCHQVCRKAPKAADNASR